MNANRIATVCGWVTMTAAVTIVLSTAFLRGGHPPGSAYVNLIAIVVCYPAALIGSVVGLRASTPSKPAAVMAGVCLLFATVVTLGLVLKLGFGQSI